MKKNKKSKTKEVPYIPKSIFDRENWAGDDEMIFEKKSKFGKIIRMIILATILLWITVWFSNITEKRIAVQKCETLKSYSQEYHPNFFVTYWQHQVCAYHGFGFTGGKKAPIHVDTVPKGQGLVDDIWYVDSNGLEWLGDKE